MKSCHLIEVRTLHMVVSKRGQVLIDHERSTDTLYLGSLCWVHVAHLPHDVSFAHGGIK